MRLGSSVPYRFSQPPPPPPILPLRGFLLDSPECTLKANVRQLGFPRDSSPPEGSSMHFAVRGTQQVGLKNLLTLSPIAFQSHSAQRLNRETLEPQNPTWTPKGPKVCRIIAFMAIIMGLGLLFYTHSGSR